MKSPEDTNVLGKRRRSWNDDQKQVARKALQYHLDLEEHIRLRAIESATAKIEWAETMRKALIQSVQNGSVGPLEHEFHNESAQILQAIGLVQPSQLPTPTLLPSLMYASSPSVHLRESSLAPSNNLEGSLVAPQLQSSDVQPSAFRPLFIEPEIASGDMPVTVLIACETCGRSDFPTIHSLLSHARMSHEISYPSHEELARRCGRVISGPEVARIRQFGTQASSRVLFGMRAAIEESLREANDGVSRTAVRTLDLRADSIPLARLIQKEAGAPSIRVYEPTGDIDVETIEDDTQWFGPNPSLLLPAHHHPRGDDPEIEVQDEELESIPEDVAPQQAEPLGADLNSRFHLKRRLVLIDSSDRPSPPQTHQWMITVSAPSYTAHITTFLSKMTVSKFIHESTLYLELGSTCDPPFSVYGIASEPFLATIHLEWIGNTSRPLTVTHWIRLDATKSSRVVTGDTQMMDIELDRSTSFAPEQLVAAFRFPIVSLFRQEPQHHQNRSPAQTQVPGDEQTLLETLSPVLKKLLAKIPLTSHDLRARAVNAKTVSYALPRSLNEFLKLEHGRRKAYEWRHAVSLRALLFKSAQSDPSLSPYLSKIHALTSGSIYRWMDESDVFSRPASTAIDPSWSLAMEATFCRFCGLALDAHPQRSAEPEVAPEERIEDVIYDSPARYPVICPEAFNRTPIVQPSHSVANLSNLVPPRLEPVGLSGVDLMRWTDPLTIQYIQDLIGTFGLRGFDALSLSATSYETNAESAVAPYALLANCLSIVVKDLVQGGVTAAKRIGAQVRARRETEFIAQAFAAGDPFPSIPESTSSAKQILTPSHILRGLTEPSRRMVLLRAAVSRLPGEPPTNHAAFTLYPQAS
ncbi:hypothetical protein DL93DRAFT_2093302 [Clavulina sp. PMI_390]|nr:hypothetical protein DL93DRAFT_2093302 [Clavulina sp. PMI_390]